MLLFGMIWFQEDAWEWQEYKLVDESTNTILWLSIEEVEGSTKYSIYYDYIGTRVYQDINIVVGNENYSLFEKGSAVVKSYYGNVDVDVREKVNFVEYISDSKQSLFSIEYWDGEIEQTMGRYIEPPDIKITNEISQDQNKQSIDSNYSIGKASKIISITIFSLFAIAFIFPIISQIIASNKSIGKYLEKSSNYTYVTSVTNNSNNKKANVYKSSKSSIDETVKDIINGVPEKINKVSQTNNNNTSNNSYNTSTNSITNTTNSKSETTNNNGIGLITNSEYAYVYKGENDNIYVQVSNKDYVNNSSTVYNSRSHSHYYRTYISPSTSSNYDSYLSSARQSSTSSRISSGGGTSAGK